MATAELVSPTGGTAQLSPWRTGLIPSAGELSHLQLPVKASDLAAAGGLLGHLGPEEEVLSPPPRFHQQRLALLSAETSSFRSSAAETVSSPGREHDLHEATVGEEEPAQPPAAGPEPPAADAYPEPPAADADAEAPAGDSEAPAEEPGAGGDEAGAEPAVEEEEEEEAGGDADGTGAGPAEEEEAEADGAPGAEEGGGGGGGDGAVGEEAAAPGAEEGGGGEAGADGEAAVAAGAGAEAEEGGSPAPGSAHSPELDPAGAAEYEAGAGSPQPDQPDPPERPAGEAQPPRADLTVAEAAQAAAEALAGQPESPRRRAAEAKGGGAGQRRASQRRVSVAAAAAEPPAGRAAAREHEGPSKAEAEEAEEEEEGAVPDTPLSRLAVALFDAAAAAAAAGRAGPAAGAPRLAAALRRELARRCAGSEAAPGAAPDLERCRELAEEAAGRPRTRPARGGCGEEVGPAALLRAAEAAPALRPCACRPPLLTSRSLRGPPAAQPLEEAAMPHRPEAPARCDRCSASAVGARRVSAFLAAERARAAAEAAGRAGRPGLPAAPSHKDLALPPEVAGGASLAPAPPPPAAPPLSHAHSPPEALPSPRARFENGPMQPLLPASTCSVPPPRACPRAPSRPPPRPRRRPRPRAAPSPPRVLPPARPALQPPRRAPAARPSSGRCGRGPGSGARGRPGGWGGAGGDGRRARRAPGPEPPAPPTWRDFYPSPAHAPLPIVGLGPEPLAHLPSPPSPRGLNGAAPRPRYTFWRPKRPPPRARRRAGASTARVPDRWPWESDEEWGAGAPPAPRSARAALPSQPPAAAPDGLHREASRLVVFPLNGGRPRREKDAWRPLAPKLPRAFAPGGPREESEADAWYARREEERATRRAALHAAKAGRPLGLFPAAVSTLPLRSLFDPAYR
eukprot:tig00000093_g3590.t1